MNDPGRVLAELEELGTAQNRKIYARHGVGEPMFGVSFAHLRKLGKKLRYDHDLARALWASGNHDARVLALSVADPAQADPDEIESWAGEVGNYVLIDEFAAFVAATPHFGACADDWTDRDGEWVASAGWSLVAQQALRDDELPDEPLPDEYFDERLRTIEARIGSAANRVRHCMNGALIAIGGRNEALRESCHRPRPGASARSSSTTARPPARPPRLSPTSTASGPDGCAPRPDTPRRRFRRPSAPCAARRRGECARRSRSRRAPMPGR